MEQKRYQIFLSSTFSDLEVERRKVMQTLLELNCIPSGMEFFPASDEETFEFIKTVIDICDYYLLIVSGRYGSVASDGVSYTEKEYDYATAIGKPVLGFVRKDLTQITVAQTDRDPMLAEKLEAFRSKVGRGRLVRMWDNGDQLAGQVATTLTSAINRYPAIGWIRGDRTANIDALNELNRIRKENEELRSRVAAIRPPVEIENLAELDDHFTFSVNITGSHKHKQSITLSWGEILSAIGEGYRTPSNIASMNRLETFIAKKINIIDTISVPYDLREQILLQFEIMGVMSAQNLALTRGGFATFHSLTQLGMSEFLRRRAILKKGP